MDTIILSFLVVAVLIIVAAAMLTRLFRKSIARDERNTDLNRDSKNATDHGTWIGIRKGGDDDYS